MGDFFKFFYLNFLFKLQAALDSHTIRRLFQSNKNKKGNQMGIFSRCQWDVPACDVSGPALKKAVYGCLAYVGSMSSAWVLVQYLMLSQQNGVKDSDRDLWTSYAAAIAPLGSSFAYFFTRLKDLDRHCGFDESEPSESFWNTRVLPFLAHLFFLSTMSFVSAIVLSLNTSFKISHEAGIQLLKGFGASALIISIPVIAIGILSYRAQRAHAQRSGLRQPLNRSPESPENPGSFGDSALVISPSDRLDVQHAGGVSHGH